MDADPRQPGHAPALVGAMVRHSLGTGRCHCATPTSCGPAITASSPPCSARHARGLDRRGQHHGIGRPDLARRPCRPDPDPDARRTGGRGRPSGRCGNRAVRYPGPGDRPADHRGCRPTASGITAHRDPGSHPGAGGEASPSPRGWAACRSPSARRVDRIRSAARATGPGTTWALDVSPALDAQAGHIQPARCASIKGRMA